jgi:hypothetical protein
MTDGQRSSAVVRRAGTRGVHLVFAALGRLVGVRRPLLLAHGVGCCGVGWVPRVLDAGSLDILFRAFRRFLGVYRSSLIARSSFGVLRSTAFFPVSIPGPGPTVTVHLPFRMKMVRKV